jgi:hypothetical protein
VTRFLLGSAAAFSLLTGTAPAQTPASATTITPSVSAPVTISSTANTANSVRPDGDQTSMSGTASRDSSGKSTETTITNTSYPFSNLITTTRKTTNIVNGVATETVTTTQTYPPGTATVAPMVTTTTQSRAADTK